MVTDQECLVEEFHRLELLILPIAATAQLLTAVAFYLGRSNLFWAAVGSTFVEGMGKCRAG